MTALRLIGWTATAVVVVAVAPPVAPLLSQPVPAVPAGIAGGALLFAVLARRPISLSTLATVPRARLAARALVLTVKSFQEEAIWRALVLGGLIGTLGRVGALVTSTALFAAAHVRGQGRHAVVHLATGTAFGIAYLATGRLETAIATHTAYNVLVGAGLLTTTTMSLSASSGSVVRVVRSTVPPFHDIPEAQTLSSMPAPYARLEAATKSFGETRALEAVDLDLRPGEILGLLGPNGAGKSTAIGLLLGLRRPDTGLALLFDQDPRNVDARRRIGVVLQEAHFPQVLRVREVVDLVRAHFRDAAPRDDLLERLDLTDLRDRQVGGLSGGQKRRLAVALALAGRPSVLFLDEPTAGLDANGKRALWRELSAFAAAGGAVLLTTQQLEEAERYATRLVVLARGRVLVEGTVGEIRARAGKARVSLCADRLPMRPEADSAESIRGRHVVYVDDPEAFISQLVRAGISFNELEVTRVRLEDAFVALTEDDR